MPEKFDVIIVGAGPAGLAAGYILAGKGLKTIIFERGDYPGSKNVMGGILYRQATAEIIPGFWQEAPLERPIIEQRYMVLAEKSGVTVSYKSSDFGQEPYNAFSVFRAKFDRWLAKRVEAAGALIITETVVEELIFDGPKVKGVRVGRSEGEVYADVVILAEGVNSLLAQRAGLQKWLDSKYLAVAVKEIHALPKEKIEDRFNIEAGQGVAIELVGEATQSMVGTGFIYTNKDSLSVGVGALLSDVIKKVITPNDLIELMKNHPLVKPLLAGSEIKEYMAHLIPEGGLKGMGKLYAPGVLVVGDAAMLVNGIHREGSNLAMISGKVAAETVLEAKQIGDYSEKTLSRYQTALEETFVLQDLKKYQNSSLLFEKNPHLFELYPELANKAMHEYFTVDSIPKKEKQRIIWQMIKKQRGPWQLITDMARIWRTMG